MKNIIFLILGIFLIGLVSAGQAGEVLSDRAKVNSCYYFPQVCASCSYSEVSSVISPNGTLYLIDSAMVNNGTFYYYEFCNINETGMYQVNGHYDVSGVDRVFNYYVESTNTGTDPTPAQGSFSLVVIIGALVIMLFFGFLSFKFLENDSMFGFGLFFLVMSLILAVYSLFIGFIFSRDFLLTSISDVQGKVFTGSMFALVGMMFIAFTFLIIKVIKTLKVQKDAKTYGEGYNSKTKTYDY